MKKLRVLIFAQIQKWAKSGLQKCLNYLFLTIDFCKSSRVKVEKSQKRQAQTLYRLGILGTEFFLHTLQ